MKEKKKLGKNLKLQEVAIPAFTVFVGNWYVRNGGAGKKLYHELQYQTYVIPEGRKLKDDVAIHMVGRLITRRVWEVV